MRSRPSLVVIAFAGVSLVAAGCGGGSSGSTTATQSHLAFARCMRSNGVPNFPDRGKPTPQQLGVSDAQFREGVSACSHLLENGGVSQETEQQKRTRLADELSFATCMRRRGVARFPDPTAQGELSVQMVEARGIDVHAPAVLRVVQACLPASHGGLTAAKVREAIRNAGR
jgi:hypothetical protein